MADRRFPPAGDPDRFDAIVARGTALRRRRRAGAGAGVGGSLAAIAVAAVLLTGTSGTPTPNVVADGDDPVTAETTVSPPPDRLTASIDVSAEGSEPIVVIVDDPAQPISDSSRQCVAITVSDAEDPDAGAVAEGHGCVEPGSGASTGDSLVLPLRPTSPVAISCAATLERVTDVDPEVTTRARSTFEVSVPELPAGAYRVEVTASSGPGDGCSPEPAPHEQRVTASATLHTP